ncbi:MAG: Fur family transcriptional regulator [Pseudomonadales bacterium]
MAKAATKIPRFAERWRPLAEARSAAAGQRLTPARLLAYAELQESGKPLSAYALLALLETRQKKKIAPLTVYRHLEFLMGIGLVHRIESTQAYLPCDHPDHQHESQYLLCSECGNADELESKRLKKLLDQIAGKHGFEFRKAVVELSGRCADCSRIGKDSA